VDSITLPLLNSIGHTLLGGALDKPHLLGTALVSWPNRRRIFCRLLCIALPTALYCGSARCEDLIKLSDLSDTQRAELFTQIDYYGLVTAFLDYCQRPPNLVQRLTPIVQGCVDPASYTAVLDRYTTAIVENSGPYNCRGPGWEKKIPEFEAKIVSLLSSMKTACRFRSLYRVSFPKIN
jgi:hypothetical protein